MEALYSSETLTRRCQTIACGHDTDGQEVICSLFSKDIQMHVAKSHSWLFLVFLLRRVPEKQKSFQKAWIKNVIWNRRATCVPWTNCLLEETLVYVRYSFHT